MTIINSPDYGTRNAMLKLYTDHQTYSGVASASAMTVLGVVLWNNFPNKEVLIWLACGYAISLIRALVHPWIERHIAENKQYRYNQYAVLTIVCISAAVWGAAAWLFLDMAQTEIFVFVIVIISGMCAAAISTHASYLLAMWTFLCITLGLLTLKLYSMGYESLAALAILFGLVLVSLTRSLHRIIQKSITIDQRNKILLEEATAAREVAENASRAKSRFLATASHDLRQPLHAIALLINLLKLKCQDPEQQRIADNMESSTDAMMALFDSILDVSRLDAGITRAYIVATDLHAIIHTLLLQFKNQAAKKGLQLDVEYYNLSADKPCLVMADKIHLERCLNNIVNNAIKFTSSGNITIRLSEQGDRVQAAVSDTGEGIAANDIEHIFNEFSQARQSGRAQGQGLGLGLSIVKRLSELMHIQLEVSSAPGKGSCFSLSMNKAPKDAILANTTDKMPMDISFSDLTILIVDDDDAVRDSLAQLIESWDCQVLTASDLPQAIAAAGQAAQIDALLVDYGLRNGVTGEAVIEHLYNSLLPGKPPALIITGDTSSQSMAALNASGFAYLHKPAKPIKIRNFLQRHCLQNTMQ